MKKREMIGIVGMFVILAGVALAGGLKFKPTVHGTFSGGTGSYTNGAERVGLAGAFLTGTISNFTIKVCNETGYTNGLAAQYTNELSYLDGGIAIVLEKDATVLFETVSTNAAKYTLYLTDIAK